MVLAVVALIGQTALRSGQKHWMMDVYGVDVVYWDLSKTFIEGNDRDAILKIFLNWINSSRSTIGRYYSHNLNRSQTDPTI